MTCLELTCLSYLWNVTIQATVILVLAWAVTALSRRQSASFRHLIWAVCLLSLPFQPIIAHISNASFLFPTQRPSDSVPPTSAPTFQGVKTSPSRAVSAPQPAVNFPTHSFFSPALHPRVLTSVNAAQWKLFLLGLWLVGMFALLARLAAGFLAVRALKAASGLVSLGPLVTAVSAVTSLPGLPHIEFRVASSREAQIPVTWGAVRPSMLQPPVILLPADASTWPQERLRAVLLHETAHVQRQDWLTQTLIHCVCALLWFHPGVWLAACACRAESERACDDCVLATGMSAPDYARHLLDVARGVSGHHVTGAVAMAQSTRIATRVRDILAPKRDRRPLTNGLWLAGTVVSILLIAAAGALAQATGLKGQTVQTVPSSNSDTATDASQTAALPENFHLSLALIVQSPSSPGTKECTFGSTFSYDPYKQPSVLWAGQPNPIAHFRQTFYSEPLDAVKGLYFSTPAFVGAFDQVGAKPPLLQLDTALMRISTGPYEMGIQVRPSATGVHIITLMHAFPASVSSVPFKFGIADGPFQMVTCSKTSRKTEISDPAGPTAFTFDPAPDARGRVALQISDSFPPNDQRIILALDGSGRAVYEIKEDFGSSDSKLPTNLSCHFPVSVLPRVTQFRLLYRPYVWVSRTLTVEPNPAKMPGTAQFANVRASFPGGPVEKIVAERVSYDAKNKITIFQYATVTLAYKGRILGIARCRHANHNSDGGWTLWDATVLPSQGTTFHTNCYFLKADGRAIIEYP